MSLRNIMMGAIALAGVALAAPASASNQIVLAPADVIGSSGYYTACCSFQPGNILDQQTTAVTETAQSGYWLNPDNGPANAYLTVDLGATYSLSDLQLFQTHNDTYGDRGTGDFTIIGGNTESGGMLTGLTVLLASGTLTATSTSLTTIPGVDFTSLSSQGVRYLEFLPTSVASINGACCGANVYGLDELKVFGSAVPEPADWALMLGGLAAVGGALRGSRRKTAAAAAI